MSRSLADGLIHWLSSCRSPQGRGVEPGRCPPSVLSRWLRYGRRLGSAAVTRYSGAAYWPAALSRQLPGESSGGKQHRHSREPVTGRPPAIPRPPLPVIPTRAPREPVTGRPPAIPRPPLPVIPTPGPAGAGHRPSQVIPTPGPAGAGVGMTR